MMSLKIGGMQLPFIAGAFVASPELRAYAANSVDSYDMRSDLDYLVGISSSTGNK
jgi:hypothetical protein